VLRQSCSGLGPFGHGQLAGALASDRSAEPVLLSVKLIQFQYHAPFAEG
jgi:hypothetical protein